jgi:hypothetical protein
MLEVRTEIGCGATPDFAELMMGMIFSIWQLGEPKSGLAAGSPNHCLN